MAISQQEFSEAAKRTKNFETLKKMQQLGLTHFTSIAVVKLGILHDRIIAAKAECDFRTDLMEIIGYHMPDDWKQSSLDNFPAVAEGEIEFLFGFDWSNPSKGIDAYQEKPNAFLVD